jgi:hypothetical protein
MLKKTRIVATPTPQRSASAIAASARPALGGNARFLFGDARVGPGYRVPFTTAVGASRVGVGAMA